MRTVFALTLFILIPTFSNAQFNENLEKEILALNSKHNLNGFERAEALDILEEITPYLDSTTIAKDLTGEPWKYSHSVSNEGRKYRESTAIYMYEFEPSGDAYMTTKEAKKTYCNWMIGRTPFFEVARFSSSSKETKTRTDYMGIHMITEDRLVFTKIIRSKKFSGKSAILFLVYFRR